MSDRTPSPGSTPPGDGHKGKNSLGVAGSMAKAFIHSPLSPLFLFACLAMGIMGLFLTPRQEDPQISVPMVDIFVNYPGASSEQVGTLVAYPLERIMSELEGVKHVYSASMRGQAMVTVEFDVGENMEQSIVKLHDRIQANVDKIPPGASQPLVKSKKVDDVPMVALTLWSKDIDDSALRILSMDLLQRLKEVPDTSEGFVVGGRSEQIRLEVYPERLSGFGISLEQIAHTIQTANAEQGVGSVESGDQGMRVYTGAFLRNAHDISRLVVGTRQNVPIYVGDVARVFAGPSETQQMVNYYTGPAAAEETAKANGEAAVTIAVAKKPGSNGVTVAQNVLAKVEELKGQLIPGNVHVEVTRNYGETANEKVNELLFKLFIATMAVMALVWLSLGLRPALVTLIVIPVVILMTVFAAWLMGYTIDRVSLFALIFSIGILVDDAIVVVENIYRRWLLENSCCHLVSVDAVREVGNPTILATFTVIAALLPMGFVRGMMGPYMEPIPALGSVAMVVSLVAAFVFTPWLTQLIKPPMRTLHMASEKEHGQVRAMERFYRAIIPPLVRDRKKGYLFLLGLIAAFCFSMLMFYTTWVTVKILPLDNKPEFNVVINMADGTALPKTANLTQRITQKIRENVPEVTALQTYVGTASPFNFNGMVRHYYLRQEASQADIQVQLIHKKHRKRTSHDIAVAVRDMITPMAHEVGAKVQVVEMPPGPPVLQSVVAEVTGPDANTRRQVAADMTTMFEKSESIVDVDNYMQEPFEIWRFEVDTEKAVRRGVSVDTINRNLGMAMGGFTLGDVKRGAVLEPTYIVMQVPLEIRAKVTSLGDLPIPTAMGTTIPLAEVGRFVKAYQDPIIYHKDLRPVEYVTGEVVGRLDAPIYAMFEVEDQLKNYRTPDNVTLAGLYLGPPESYSKSAFEWTGEWTVTFETFRDMGMAFGAALILIYMLVVWEFGNFILPAIIMAPIPLTLIGIVPGHWLLDAKFTATSMIGFIALAGIIVRNSILLVDFSQQEIMKGSTVLDAVIMSCKARTRPILITAFALVAGSSVILFDFIFQGMAISLLFGVLVSTLLTLIVIPLGCISAEKAFKKPEPGTVPVMSSSLAMYSDDDDDEDEAGESRERHIAKAKAFLARYNPTGDSASTPPDPAAEMAKQTKVANAKAFLSRFGGPGIAPTAAAVGEEPPGDDAPAVPAAPPEVMATPAETMAPAVMVTPAAPEVTVAPVATVAPAVMVTPAAPEVTVAPVATVEVPAATPSPYQPPPAPLASVNAVDDPVAAISPVSVAVALEQQATPAPRRRVTRARKAPEAAATTAPAVIVEVTPVVTAPPLGDGGEGLTGAERTVDNNATGKRRGIRLKPKLGEG